MNSFFISVLITALTFYETDFKACCDFDFIREIKTEVSHLHSNSISEVIVDKDGNIIASDNWLAKVMVFNSDGDFMFELGSKGQWPGDFQSIFSIRIVDDNLVILNSNLQRITEIDPFTKQVKATYSIPGKNYLRGTSGIILDEENVLMNYALPFRSGDLHCMREGTFGIVSFRESAQVEKLFTRDYYDSMVIRFPGGGFAATSRPYANFNIDNYKFNSFTSKLVYMSW